MFHLFATTQPLSMDKAKSAIVNKQINLLFNKHLIIINTCCGYLKHLWRMDTDSGSCHPWLSASNTEPSLTKIQSTAKQDTNSVSVITVTNLLAEIEISTESTTKLDSAVDG
jgi:hypothetical protein